MPKKLTSTGVLYGSLPNIWPVEARSSVFSFQEKTWTFYNDMAFMGSGSQYTYVDMALHDKHKINVLQ